jgi:hypothetical protein
MKWHTEQRKINDLIPSENNPRQLTEKQHKDLEKSLKKFDLVEIPAINVDGQILAGHMRLKILQQLERGDEIIDVRVPDKKLSKKDCDEYIVRSNKNTGEWDFDKLLINFDIPELKEWGFDDFELHLGDDTIIEDKSEEKSLLKECECPKCGYKWKESKYPTDKSVGFKPD